MRKANLKMFEVARFLSVHMSVSWWGRLLMTGFQPVGQSIMTQKQRIGISTTKPPRHHPGSRPQRDNPSFATRWCSPMSSLLAFVVEAHSLRMAHVWCLTIYNVRSFGFQPWLSRSSRRVAFVLRHIHTDWPMCAVPDGIQCALFLLVRSRAQ